MSKPFKGRNCQYASQEVMVLIDVSIIHMDYPIGRSPGVNVVPLLIHRNDHINLKESRCFSSFHSCAHQVRQVHLIQIPT